MQIVSNRDNLHETSKPIFLFNGDNLYETSEPTFWKKKKSEKKNQNVVCSSRKHANIILTPLNPTFIK